MSRPHAILLLGPTGSGKTPLGEMLQARGLGTGRCMHFDFGDRLRRIASGQLNVDELAGDDRAFITKVLDHGALLEDEHFGVAEKILRAFLAEKRHGRDAHATVVLNGLPRHIGQADNVDRIVTVRLVIELSCSAQTVRRRLADDTGGDRAGRIDDDPARVRNKLELYTSRTEGLLDHYRSLGAAVISLTVGPDTTAQDAWRELILREPERLQQHSPGQSEGPLRGAKRRPGYERTTDKSHERAQQALLHHIMTHLQGFCQRERTPPRALPGLCCLSPLGSWNRDSMPYLLAIRGCARIFWQWSF